MLSVSTAHADASVSTLELCSVGGVMSFGKDGTVVPKKRTEIARRVAAFLRMLYPVKTSDQVAADLSLTPEAIRKWQSRESAPSLETFGDMGEVYGPEFVLRVFPQWTWLDPLVRRRLAEKLEAKIVERERQLAELRG